MNPLEQIRDLEHGLQAGAVEPKEVEAALRSLFRYGGRAGSVVQIVRQWAEDCAPLTSATPTRPSDEQVLTDFNSFVDQRDDVLLQALVLAAREYPADIIGLISGTSADQSNLLVIDAIAESGAACKETRLLASTVHGRRAPTVIAAATLLSDIDSPWALIGLELMTAGATAETEPLLRGMLATLDQLSTSRMKLRWLADGLDSPEDFDDDCLLALVTLPLDTRKQLADGLCSRPLLR